MRKRLLSFIAAAGMLFAGAGTAWAETGQVIYKIGDSGTGFSTSDKTSVTSSTSSPMWTSTDKSISLMYGIDSWSKIGSKSGTTATIGTTSFSKYVAGSTNPTDASGLTSGFSATNLPVKGAYIVLNPVYSGTITVALVAVAGKPAWAVKSGDDPKLLDLVLTASSNTTITSGTTVGSSSSTYSGGLQFTVEGGNEYYFFLSGSKMSYCGFVYDYEIVDENSVKVEWSWTYDDTVGKYRLTLTSDPSNATIGYRVGDAEDALEYDGPFLVDPEATVKVSATSDDLEPVKDQVITIPAMPKATAATYAEEYDDSKEQYLVTLTGASSYQIGEGEKTAYTDPFYADPKASITAYATKTNYAESSKVFTVSAKPTVATPVITVAQNAAYRTYTITLSSTDESTLSYVVGSNASQEYTKPFVVNPGTKVTVTATKKGYTSSTNTVTPAVYPTSSPASETTTAGEKDVTQTGFSYSINGPTYIAQPGSGDYSSYIKMRTNKIAGQYKDAETTGLGFRIDVNSGYTITGIVLRGHSNNDKTAVSIDAIAVDGQEISDFTAVSLPVSGSASTTEKRLTLTGINAKESIDFKCTGYTQAIVQFDFTFTMPDQIIPVTLDETVGYATYYSDKALKFNADNVTVYTGAINGTSLVLSEVKDAIPAKTAVILKGDADKVVEFTVTSEEVPAIEGTNDLKGVTEATALENVYVLSYKTGLEDVGFYKAASVTVPANKAYVEWPAEATAAEAPVLRFNFGETDEPGNVTGINAVAIENNAQQVIYDLRGRRVQSLDRPGLYIVNGKKVAVQ